MSLDGAKLICLDEKGGQGENILAKGRKFTIGYYMSCDYVLSDSNAKGVHCEINCDAFGRVTIHNMSLEHPISVNDIVIKIKRPLLHGSKINILGRNYLWELPKANSSELEVTDTEALSTPPKQISKPEQPPNSCPYLKLHHDLQRRLTIHNFAYCIQAEEAATTTTTTDKINTSLGTQPSQFSETDCVPLKANAALLVPTMEEAGNEERGITPEPENRSLLINVADTPKIDLINCTLNKENVGDTKKVKTVRACGLSDIIITSFSPRETGVRIEKSFTAVLKPTSAHSVYGTPWKANNGDRSLDFIDFSTTATSIKKSNSSMHLIDLTTPGRKKLAPAIDPLPENRLKSSSSAMKLVGDKLKLSPNESGLSLLGTPDVVTTMNSSGSVISVDSTDSSSVVELSDSSVPSCSSAAVAAAAVAVSTCTPKKVFSPKALTPKRTPQSLMKRALLTSAKKRGITPVSTVAAVPRSSANVLPSRRDACTPSTPSPRRIQFVAQRVSMSTPSRRSGVMSRLRLDAASPGTPSSSLLLKSANTKRSPPASSSIGKLSTSTPLRRSSSVQRGAGAGALKTSPELHKVRKFIGGTPLTSHISKIRKSLAVSRSTTTDLTTPASPSTSAKLQNKPTYVPSPANARARAIAASIIKSPQFSVKKTEETKTSDLLVPGKQNETMLNKSNELNRTFTLDSSDPAVSEVPDVSAKNVTFSPDKKAATANKNDTISPDLPKAEGEANTTKEVEKLKVLFLPDKSDVIALEHDNSKDSDHGADLCASRIDARLDREANANLSVVKQKPPVAPSIIQQNNPKDFDPQDLETCDDHGKSKDLSVVNTERVLASSVVFTAGNEPLSIEQTISPSSSATTKTNATNATMAEILTKNEEQENADLLEQIEDVLNKSDELQKHLEVSMEPSTVSVDVGPNAVEAGAAIEKLSEEFEEVEDELESVASNKLETKLSKAQKPDSCSSSLLHDADHYFTENSSDPENENASAGLFKAQENVSETISEIITGENSSSNISVVPEELVMPEKLSECPRTTEDLPYESSAETLLNKTKDKNENHKISKDPRAQPETPNLRGIKEMLKTPKVEKQVVDTSILKAVQNILCTPEQQAWINEELDQTPRPTSSVRSDERNFNLTTPRRSARRASMTMTTQSASQVLTPKRRATRRASMSTESGNLLTPKRIMTRRASFSIEKKVAVVSLIEPKRKESLILFEEEEVEDVDNETTTNSGKIVLLETHKFAAELAQKDDIPPQRSLVESSHTERDGKEVPDDTNILPGDSNISDVMHIENAEIESQCDVTAVLAEDRICEIVHDSADITLKDDQPDRGPPDNACKIVDASDYEYGKEIKDGGDSETDTNKDPIISKDPKTTTSQVAENKTSPEEPQFPKKTVPVLDQANNNVSLIETESEKSQLEKEIEFLCTQPSTSTRNTTPGTDLKRIQFKCPPRSSTPNTTKKEKSLPLAFVDDNKEDSNSSLLECNTPSKGRVSKFLIERGLLPKPENFNAKMVDASHETEDEGLDKFFSTPRAKDMMIPMSPKSVNLKPNIDSVETEEYEMSTTNLDNLDDMFKTPVSTRYTRYIENFNGTTETSLADAKEDPDLRRKLSPEEAFDRLVGRNSITRTPEPKVYTHKLLVNSSPSVLKSPFSATDIISDLPKTDIQEWVDSLEDVDIPKDSQLQEESIFANEVDISGSSREISRDPLALSTMALEDSISKQNTDAAAAPTSIFDISASSVSAAGDALTAGVCLLTGEESNRLETSGENETVRITSCKTDDADISGIDLLEQSDDSALSGPLLTETESSVSKTLVEETVLNSKNECKLNFADEFKHFNDGESRRGVLNRSITPNNCALAVKVPRRSLGNREDLKVTIDFQCKKLKKINEELPQDIPLEQEEETEREMSKVDMEKPVVREEGVSFDRAQTQSETTTDPSGGLRETSIADHEISDADGVIMLDQEVDGNATVTAVVVVDKDNDNLAIALEVPSVQVSEGGKEPITHLATSSMIVDETDMQRVSKEPQEIDNKNIIIEEVSSSSKETVADSVGFTEENVNSRQLNDDDDDEFRQQDIDKKTCAPSNIEVVETIEIMAKTEDTNRGTIEASSEGLTIAMSSKEDEQFKEVIATAENATGGSHAAPEIMQPDNEKLCKETAKNNAHTENVDMTPQPNTANDENTDLVIKDSAEAGSKSAQVNEEITSGNMKINSEVIGIKSPKASSEDIFESPLETVANEEDPHNETDDDNLTKEQISQETQITKQKTSENRESDNQPSVINENEKSTNLDLIIDTKRKITIDSNDDDLKVGESSDVGRKDETSVVKLIKENKEDSSEEVAEEGKQMAAIIPSNEMLEAANKDNKNENCKEKLTLKATITDLKKEGEENNSSHTKLTQGINHNETDEALLTNVSSSPGHSSIVIEEDPAKQSAATKAANTENSENQLIVDEDIDIRRVVEEKQEPKEQQEHPEVAEKSRPKRTRAVKRKVLRGESEEPENIVKKMPTRRGGQKRKAVEANIQINIITDSAEDRATTPTKNVKDGAEELPATPKSTEVGSTPSLSQNVAEGMFQAAAAANLCTQDTQTPSISARILEPLVTSRGRTRKPTARAQQFLEEERAKASTPKRRQLLASGGKGCSATPQRTPRSRKGKINIESELLASSTPHQSVSCSLLFSKDVIAEHVEQEREDEDTPLNRLLSGLVTQKMLQVSTVQNETNASIVTPQSVKRRARGRKVLHSEKSELNFESEPSTDDHVQKSPSIKDEEVKSSSTHEDAKTIPPLKTDGVQAPPQVRARLRRKASTVESERNDPVTAKKPVKRSERKRKLTTEQTSEPLSDSGGLEDYIDRAGDETLPQKVPSQRRRNKASPRDTEKVISTTEKQQQQRVTRGCRGRKALTEATSHSEQSHSELEHVSTKESSNNIEEEADKSKKARGRARKNVVKEEISKEGEDHSKSHDFAHTSQTDMKRPTRRGRAASTNDKKVISATPQKKIVGKGAAGHSSHQVENESDTMTDANVIKSEGEENPLSTLVNISKEEEKSIRSLRTRKCNDLLKNHTAYSEATDNDDDDDEPIAKKIPKAASKESVVADTATTSRRTARKRDGQLSAIDGTLAEHNDKVVKGSAQTESDKPKSSRTRRGGARSKQPATEDRDDVESMSSVSTVPEHTDHEKEKPKVADSVVDQKKEVVKKKSKTESDKPKSSRARRGGAASKQLPVNSEDVESMSSAPTMQEYVDHDKKEEEPKSIDTDTTVAEHKEEEAVEENADAGNENPKKSRARRVGVGRKQMQHNNEKGESVSSPVPTGQEHANQEKEKPNSTRTRRGKVIQEPIAEEKEEEETARPTRSRRGEGKNKLKNLSKEDKKQEEHKVASASTLEGKDDHRASNPDEYNEEITDLKMEKSTNATVGTKRSAENTAATTSTLAAVAPKRNRRNEVPAERSSISPQPVKTRGVTRTRKVTFESPVMIVEASVVDDGATKRPKRTTRKK